MEAFPTKKWTNRYLNMAGTDTLQLKFTAKVKEVCQAKGCWMKLELANGSEVMVRFKEYGFFVPKDGQGKQVIVNGSAFVSVLGVEEQRHYAKDAGEPTAVIDQINQPKKTLWI